jgi:hypothetical protein
MSDVRINTRSPYYIEANPTEPIIPEEPEIPDPPTNIPPTVTITASNTTPYAGETVTLTAVATDSDGTIVSYLWGGTSSPQTSVSIDVTSTAVQSKIFNVAVTDNDGDVGVAQITINWQEIPEQTTNTDIDVNCGDVINEGSFIGIKTYNLVGVGDKIGDVEIEFLDGEGRRDTPVKFDITWDGNTETTGYIGDSDFSLSDPIPPPDNTTSPTNKKQPTTLVINKTAATPTQVTLTAEPLFPNDSYSFRLNCPDVEATETFFYTLTGTCTTGDTTFTYTDVNGDPQTVILANGETELVSAQEDTVSAAVCTGTIDGGGQSFDLGVPEQEYDENTELIIIFDDSGSMESTLQPLLDMANGNLRTSLISFYNNDVTEYNKKVKVYKSSEFIKDNYPSLNFNSNSVKERFLKIASFGKINSTSTRSIYLFFQDEVQASYQASTYLSPDSSYDSTTNFYGEPTAYQEDLNEYKTFLNSLNYGGHFMKFFPVSSGEAFETQFIRNIFSGNEGFDGNKGLSDRAEVSIESSLVQNGTQYSSNPNYYHDLIIETLRNYGFNI